MMGVRKIQQQFENVYIYIGFPIIPLFHIMVHISPQYIPPIGIPLQFHDIAQILLKSW
jgi:hypothetical protein